MSGIHQLRISNERRHLRSFHTWRSLTSRVKAAPCIVIAFSLEHRCMQTVQAKALLFSQVQEMDEYQSGATCHASAS